VRSVFFFFSSAFPLFPRRRHSFLVDPGPSEWWLRGLGGLLQHFFSTQADSHEIIRLDPDQSDRGLRRPTGLCFHCLSPKRGGAPLTPPHPSPLLVLMTAPSASKRCPSEAGLYLAEQFFYSLSRLTLPVSSSNSFSLSMCHHPEEECPDILFAVGLSAASSSTLSRRKSHSFFYDDPPSRSRLMGAESFFNAAVVLLPPFLLLKVVRGRDHRFLFSSAFSFCLNSYPLCPS